MECGVFIVGCLFKGDPSLGIKVEKTANLLGGLLLLLLLDDFLVLLHLGLGHPLRVVAVLVFQGARVVIRCGHWSFHSVLKKRKEVCGPAPDVRGSPDNNACLQLRLCLPPLLQHVCQAGCLLLPITNSFNCLHLPLPLAAQRLGHPSPLQSLSCRSESSNKSL